MPRCPRAHRHLAQKLPQALLRPLVAARHAHAARQPDQLADGRVHHRHRLAHLAVKRCLPVQQRHIALKPSKCTASAAAQLHGGLAARASLLLPGYFHPVLSFSVLFIAPRAPPRASQCRLPRSFLRDRHGKIPHLIHRVISLLFRPVSSRSAVLPAVRRDLCKAALAALADHNLSLLQ